MNHSIKQQNYSFKRICDTDHISDNCEQQYGQLHCDIWIESDGDSIRNSCDVYY